MTPQEIDELVVLAAAWVQQQRVERRPQSAPLAERERTLLSSYYDAADLDAVRWQIVPQIENPPFRDAVAAKLEAEGLPAIDFSEMAGITFVDTIVLSHSKRPDTPRGVGLLLIHEMVHVVQYRLLGLDRFMHDYVWGLADYRFDYFSIPLEQQAYAIQELAAEGSVFRAEAALREMMALG